MSSNDIVSFALDIYQGLSDVAIELIKFLGTRPFAGQDWTYGGILFGTAFFAFLAYAVVRWIVP